MRNITDHIVSGDQAVQLQIEVRDDPGSGGANHIYQVKSGDKDEDVNFIIAFQNGPIKEFGVNGVTGEALLAIEIDRLRGFQNGPYKCRENSIALTHIEEALMWLQRRTVERIKRGVEGTHEK
jgi:hypothetical protein